MQRGGVVARRPFARLPARPPRLNHGTNPFYFGATCAHIGRTPPADVLTVDHDTNDPDPVKATLSVVWVHRIEAQHS